MPYTIAPGYIKIGVDFWFKSHFIVLSLVREPNTWFSNHVLGSVSVLRTVIYVTVLTNLGEIALAELGHGVEKSFLDVLKLRVVLGLQLGDLAHDLGERLPPEAAVLCVDLEAFV